MTSIAELLTLPLGTLVMLASGYLGYRISCVGHDGPHGAADVVFLSFTYAAIASAIIWLFGARIWLGAPVAVVVTLASSICWRLWLSPAIWRFMWRLGVSGHDRSRTVWESTMMRRLRAPTRIVVTMKNGRQMMCSDLRPFDAAPMGPCLLGPDGSVALYVTDQRDSNAADWQEQTPVDPANLAWGYEMTFIPAAEVARVAVTRPA